MATILTAFINLWWNLSNAIYLLNLTLKDAADEASPRETNRSSPNIRRVKIYLAIHASFWYMQLKWQKKTPHIKPWVSVPFNIVSNYLKVHRIQLIFNYVWIWYHPNGRYLLAVDFWGFASLGGSFSQIHGFRPIIWYKRGTYSAHSSKPRRRLKQFGTLSWKTLPFWQR